MLAGPGGQGSAAGWELGARPCLCPRKQLSFPALPPGSAGWANGQTGWRPRAPEEERMGTSRPGGAAPPSLKSLTTEGLLVPEGGEDRGSGGPKTGPPASPLDRSTQPRLGTLRGGPGPGAAVPARKKLLPFSPGWPEPDLVSGTPSRSHRQVSPGVEVRLQAWWPVYLGRQSSAPRHLPGSAALSRVLGPALSLVWTGGCKSGSKPHPTPAAHHAPAPSTPPISHFLPSPDSQQQPRPGRPRVSLGLEQDSPVKFVSRASGLPQL